MHIYVISTLESRSRTQSFSVKCTLYTVHGCKIRVQHWGDDQHILVTFLIWGGDDFKISCLGEFFLVYPNSCFSTHSHQIFLMTFSFCSPAFFPISCSNSLIPKKITPPCILRPPKYFPLEPSLKNIGAC